ICDRKLDLAAGEIVRIEFAQHEVRIGNGRSFAATLVTGWSRLGSRRFWANLNTPHGIDPGDRTTARTDLDHFDHRNGNRHSRTFTEAIGAGDLEGTCGMGLVILDQADLCCCATHIVGYDPVET